MEQLVLDLESLPCPRGILFILLTFDEVVELWNLIVIFYVVITIFEVMELISILMLTFLLSQPWVGSSFKFTLP
jgi:hypothetical protein